MLELEQQIAAQLEANNVPLRAPKVLGYKDPADGDAARKFLEGLGHINIYFCLGATDPEQCLNKQKVVFGGECIKGEIGEVFGDACPYKSKL